jgi:hypothetical protein
MPKQQRAAFARKADWFRFLAQAKEIKNGAAITARQAQLTSKRRASVR